MLCINLGLLLSKLNKNIEAEKVYKEVKREHFSRSENIPARLNTGYLDIINYYKRIADHIYNIIEYVMKI